MIRAKLLAIHKDSLFRNSFYLMLATAIVSGLGFFFWLINARLFSTEEIGLATALISTMNLVSILSLLGFNTVFIRFLPKSKRVNEEISTGLIIAGITAAVFGSVFVIFIDTFSPKLHFVSEGWSGIAFAIFCVFTALNILVESIFLAFRKTGYTLINNTLSSAAKILFPFAFIGFGAIGIFSAAALAQAIGFLLGLSVLIKKFKYRPQAAVDRVAIQHSWRYSSVNYLASIFNLLPISILPIIITNNLGASSAAYFYISIMIGNLLYVIPWSTARSLFAEGSHDEENLSGHIKKAIRMNLMLLIPAILFVIVFGKFVLGIFGEAYAQDSINFLWLVALAGIPVAINSTFGALLQIKKDPRSLVVTNIFYGVAIISLTYLFLGRDLIGVGYAWLLGNCTAAIVSSTSYFFADRIFTRLKTGTYVPRTILTLKLLSFIQCLQTGGKRKVILFYPEKPKWYHILYTIMHMHGYKITNNPNEHFDAAISFEDTTIKNEDTATARLRTTTHLINGECVDISKTHVEKVFSEVFEYGMQVDPRTHVGACVKKSDTNATHDGKVIQCPTEPETGYIYQKLIDNTYGENQVKDIRVIIYGDVIPFVVYRYKDLSDRFDQTVALEIAQKEEAFNEDEIHAILSFCKAFNLECGELDVLRDNTDGQIYIVDANLTCGGPMLGVNVSKREFKQYVSGHTTGFMSLFLQKKTAL